MENNLYNFLIILAGVAWIILALFVLSIFRCIAQLRTPKPKMCIRPQPHVCRVDGPCNGFPKPNNSRWEKDWEAIEENLRK